MSLYNKYRPQELKEIIGNKEIISYLESVIQKDVEEPPNVYLFHGPTGCGKTTLARILSKEFGCSISDLSLLEINTANFRGIDTVRELITTSKYKGFGSDGRRMWIIDEVHKMTNDAQNALLKLLEDPPKDSYFILCTTDPNKLLPTVRGRCIELGVKPLNDNQMERLLKRISKAEGQKVKRIVREQIIQDSFGLPRNAIQILEKVLGTPADKQLEIAEQSAKEYSESIELCRGLLEPSTWKMIREILKGLKDQEPESIRRHVLGYAQGVLLKSDNTKAAFILEEFTEPFYNSGFAGLILACYTIIKG